MTHVCQDQFLLLLKPASGNCNLSCRYCFYHPHGCAKSSAHMSRDTLATLTRKYLDSPVPNHIFAWQGGEPTMAGIDFFREAVRLQKTSRESHGTAAANLLQTNGTLLDDEWGDFLRNEHFLAGISLDGPPLIHNHYRNFPDGRPSFHDVLRGIEVLKHHGVDFNVLTLVSAANQDHPEDVYCFFREHGLNFLQFIECVEFDEQGKRMPYALAEGKWGEFMCRVFDTWFQYDTQYVSVRLFDSILSRLTTGDATLCQMSGSCDAYLVIEADGSVYPCDFYVRDSRKLGNILCDSFRKLRKNQRESAFFSLKANFSAMCNACKWRPLCMGDCPRVRRNSHSTLCSDWRMFYEHTIERFELLASRLSL